MGYTTEFEGKFNLNKKLDDDTFKLLNGLATTRRMKRNVEGFGNEGEFFIDGLGFCGQDNDITVIDVNKPPTTQPSLWLQWIPTEDKMSIEWDGNEKFYHSLEWIKYLIDTILKPRGYILNGTVYCQGEEENDTWNITIDENEVI